MLAGEQMRVHSASLLVSQGVWSGVVRHCRGHNHAGHHVDATWQRLARLVMFAGSLLVAETHCCLLLACWVC